MSVEVISNADAALRRKYIENRASASPDHLTEFSGRWIAWSPDGARIVAHAEAPEELDALIAQAGEDPERCVIEGIPEHDAVLGGGAFGLGLGPSQP